MREVHHRRSVGRRLVIDAELVLGRHGVGHPDPEVPGKSLLAVLVQVAEDELPFVGRHHVPDDAVQPRHASVEGLSVVVRRQRVLFAVEREAAPGDAVGIGTHDGPEEAFAPVVDVAVERFVAQHDILVAAFAVGRPERHDAPSVVGRLQCDVARAEGVQLHRLAVHRAAEGFGGQQPDLVCFRVGAAGGQKQRRGDKRSFHLFRVVGSRPGREAVIRSVRCRPCG